MSLTQVSTGMIADAAVTPGKLSTGAPSWDSSGKVTTTGSVVVADEYYTGAGVGAGASGSWQYKAGSSGFIVGNTNGTERFRIDGSGRVTKPYQPSFHVSKSNGDVPVNNVILYNYINYNMGNHYNSATGRFTAPVAGSYVFTASGINVLGGYVEGAIRRNGGEIFNSRNSTAAGNNAAYSPSGVVYLNAGDYVDVYQVVGSTYGAGTSYTYFTGALLG